MSTKLPLLLIPSWAELLSIPRWALAVGAASSPSAAGSLPREPRDISRSSRLSVRRLAQYKLLIFNK